MLKNAVVNVVTPEKWDLQCSFESGQVPSIILFWHDFSVALSELMKPCEAKCWLVTVHVSLGYPHLATSRTWFLIEVAMHCNDLSSLQLISALDLQNPQGQGGLWATVLQSVFAGTVEAENGRALEWDFVCTCIKQSLFVPASSFAALHVIWVLRFADLGLLGTQNGNFSCKCFAWFFLWDLRSLATLFDRKECKTSSPFLNFSLLLFSKSEQVANR